MLFQTHKNFCLNCLNLRALRRWTHGMMTLNTRHLFNVIMLDLDQSLHHHVLASCTVVNASTRETVEMWNKIFIFVFVAQKVFSWLRKLQLMLHGLFYQSPCYVSGHGNISVVLLSMEGLRALRFKQKYLNLCSDDERRSYGFGTTSGWVINDILFIFGWTNPLGIHVWF